jgi:hypothetical protein
LCQIQVDRQANIDLHATFSFSPTKLVDHLQNVRDIIKVLAKLSVLPSMVGLVDPAAVWMLLAEPRTFAVYVARSLSPAAVRIHKTLAEKTSSDRMTCRSCQS